MIKLNSFHFYQFYVNPSYDIWSWSWSWIEFDPSRLSRLREWTIASIAIHLEMHLFHVNQKLRNNQFLILSGSRFDTKLFLFRKEYDCFSYYIASLNNIILQKFPYRIYRLHHVIFSTMISITWNITTTILMSLPYCFMSRQSDLFSNLP